MGYDAFSPQGFPECEPNEMHPSWCGHSKKSEASKWLKPFIDARVWIYLRMFHKGITRPDYMYRGFFSEIPAADYPSLVAFALFDSDTERSIRDSWKAVFPRMSRGGTIIIHDFN